MTGLIKDDRLITKCGKSGESPQKANDKEEPDAAQHFMMLESHGDKTHQKTSQHVDDQCFIGKMTCGLIVRDQADQIAHHAA